MIKISRFIRQISRNFFFIY